MLPVILERDKYSVQPPPDILESFTDNPPVVVFRQLPTRDLKDYHGGIGKYGSDNTESTISETNITRLWLHAYLLSSLSLKSGTIYLQHIAKDDAQYPPQVLEVIRSITTSPSISNVVDHAQRLKFYIPRELFLPNLDNPENISALEFFVNNIYWLRYQRTHLSFGLKDIDLYLVTANPFERYPARKLLSYYDDYELYYTLGRQGNLFYPKVYSSKRSQLDGLVMFKLMNFGYFTVYNWTRPIKLLYHTFPEYRLVAEIISLDLTYALEHYHKFAKPLLRLAIQIQSSLPLVKDLESWSPLLNLVPELKELYNHNTGPYLPESTTVDNSRYIVPVEQVYSTCLLCEQVRDDGDFSLCGHGTCIVCQGILGSAQCPFCNEHFTADNINDEFINVLNSDGFDSARQSLLDKVRYINNLKADRTIKFDWANSDIILP